MKHNNQRVGIFIDVQNLYYSARAIYNMKVNFGEIVKTAVAGRQLIRAVGYVVRAQVPEEEEFFKALERMGIETKARDLQTFADGTKKGNWDVGMAVDMVKMAPKLDAVILASGDGDFADVMQYVKAQGARAEAICFGKSTSKILREAVDDFVDLDESSSRFLIPNRRRGRAVAPRPVTPPKEPSQPERKGHIEVASPASTIEVSQRERRKT